MKATRIIRVCDKFGHSMHMTFKGDSTYTTTSDGAASICLNLVILTFFVKQLLAVVTYKDPTISSYEVMENRSQMTEALNMADYEMSFVF